MKETDKTSEIKDILDKKQLTLPELKIAEECMVELCLQCDTKKNVAKLNSLFENLSDAIIVFDLNFNIINFNKLGKKLISKFKNFVLNEKNYLISELPILKFTLDKKENPLESIEVYSKDKYGNKHFFNIGCSPIYSELNVFIGACLLITDITETHKQARQLEDIVSALTHDLKTPLIAAETSLSQLSQGYFGEVNENQKKIIHLLRQSNNEALRLVQNLLSVFKYEAKAYKLLIETIDINFLLERAINVIKPLLDEKKIDLKTIEGNFKFVCDPFEIERVLVNLLSNSIKYTNEKGFIIIKAIKNEDGKVTISVEDNGSGISENDLPNLFERFWQSYKSNGNPRNNTGLGLYLCRQIVESHGGKIWVESELQKGTKITFEIPSLI